MQFIGPLIASLYPLERGSMVGAIGGLYYSFAIKMEMPCVGHWYRECKRAKGATGMERCLIATERGDYALKFRSINEILSYNHSFHGMELILHVESPIVQVVLTWEVGAMPVKHHLELWGLSFFLMQMEWSVVRRC